MKKVFFILVLMIISSMLIFNGCSKEEEEIVPQKTNSGNIALQTKADPEDFIGRTYNDWDDPVIPVCKRPALSCASEDVVVTPGLARVYKKLKKFIDKGTEHKFFSCNGNGASKLWPELYDESLSDYLDKLTDEDNKLIITLNKKNQLEFFHCVPDDLAPSKFNAGEQYITLVLDLSEM